MKKKRRVRCGKCGDKFSNNGMLAIHNNRKHPAPPPPPPPKKEVEVAPGDLDESFNLVNARHLEVGDVFYHVKKIVILKTVKTEGDNTVSVVGKITKRWWQKDKPSN